jgi:hypothetical protein
MPGEFVGTTHVVIADGQTVSGEADLRGLMLYAIGVPATFDGTTLSFEQAEKPLAEGGVYTPVTHLSAALAATAHAITTVAASTTLYLTSSTLPDGIGNGMIRLVAGAQTGPTEFILYFQPY